MDERKAIVAGVIYGIAAIITFGHGAANTGTRCLKDEAVCNANLDAPMNGMMAGVFWPFYWSWEVASQFERGEHKETDSAE
jgi:hypothetical protein